MTKSASPVGVIAEISGNHLGSLEKALQLITEAKNAGAAFVKFQHYRPDTITVRGNHKDLRIEDGTVWDGRTLWDLYSESFTPWAWTAELVDHCNEVGISWFSSPFDETAVDYLEELNPDLYKIASFEIVDLPLIQHIARTGKPMIISTGMATQDEISEAVAAAEDAGASDITLLRTNSAYPAPVEEMDLATLVEMKRLWGYPVGLSDHTLGYTAAVVAASLGATVFEKHLCLKRTFGGPDASFSAEPQELMEYVAAISDAQSAIGGIRFGPSPKEVKSLRFRPSLRVVEDIEIGSPITRDNVKSVRPGGGLPPKVLDDIVGKLAVRKLEAGDPVRWDDFRSA